MVKTVCEFDNDTALSIAVDADLLGRLDAWIAAHVGPASRDEAVLEILKAGLSGVKTRRTRRPVFGPIDAPMVRAGRKMKAASLRSKSARKADR